MSKLAGVFRKLEKRRVLVIGDFLCDAYTIGKANRISPEAPVAVVNVEYEEMRPGGAGNVALNLKSLGMDVIACGRIGSDPRGDELMQLLTEENISVKGFFEQPEYYTPVKNRIISDHQQIVRIDHEKITPLPEHLEQQVIDRLDQLFDEVSVVAISDYGKGFLSDTLLAALIERSQKLGIPVIVDPKGVNFSKYDGATLIKPNIKEAYLAASLPFGASLELVAERLLEITHARYLLVTRSEEGISVFDSDGTCRDFATNAKEVMDVTGAGDTVLAMLAFAFANGLDISESAELSNVAAGIAVEHLGCARVTLRDMARRLLVDKAENKVFDESHLFALLEALRGRRYQVLGVTLSDGLTSELFRAIRQLEEEDRELLLYIRDEKPPKEFVDVVASLQGVDFVILKSDSLRHLCEAISPEAVSLLEGGEVKRVVAVAQMI